HHEVAAPPPALLLPPPVRFSPRPGPPHPALARKPPGGAPAPPVPAPPRPAPRRPGPPSDRPFRQLGGPGRRVGALRRQPPGRGAPPAEPPGPRGARPAPRAARDPRGHLGRAAHCPASPLPPQKPANHPSRLLRPVVGPACARERLHRPVFRRARVPQPASVFPAAAVPLSGVFRGPPAGWHPASHPPARRPRRGVGRTSR